jgi:hypothetical protein
MMGYDHSLLDDAYDKIDRLEAEIDQLRSLVQCLLDNNPDDLAADGGVTVLDVWRKDAKRILEQNDH